MHKRLLIFSVGLCCLLALATVRVEGSFTASVTGVGTIGTGVLGLSDTVGTNTCTAVGTSSPATSCTSSISPSTVTTATTSTTATLSNIGTLASQVGLQVPTCGLAQASDSTAGANTMIAHGGVTYQAPGPLSGEAINLNGTDAYFGSTNQLAGPQSFTQLAWFETSGSGSIVSFADVPADSSPTNWDRMIWVDPSGHVVAGVYPGSTQELVSPLTYNNAGWHFVAVTLSSSGFFLYVDGTLVASSTGITSAQVFNGYWHIGWSNATQGWPDPPSSAFFPGSIAGVGILPTALTMAQISSLYNSSTLSTYSTSVLSYSPTSYWALQDPGTVAYAGSVPGAGGGTTYPDTSGNNNSASVQGGTGAGIPNSSGPLGASSVTLNGTSGWLETTNQLSGPQTFTQLAWFQTSGSGSIVSFENTQGNTALSEWDRMIWVDPSGHVVAGVYPGSTQELVSPRTYNNAGWHFVAVTLSPSGFFLYVDGARVAHTTSITSAQVYNGYWHIGWSNATQGWPDPPSSAFFPGSLAGVSILPTALTKAQISSLYNSSTLSAYSTSVLSYSPTSYWALQSTSTQTVASGCSNVEITVALGTTCIYPSTGCSTPSASWTLTELANESTTVKMMPSTQTTLNLTFEEEASLPSVLVGVHVIGAIQIDGNAGWGVSLSHPMDIEL